MFTHVMIGANDVEKARQFYDAVLGALGIGPGIDLGGRFYYQGEPAGFVVGKPINGEPACHANGGTIGFIASNEAAVEAFHQAGLDNGGATCEEPPGLRDRGDFKAYAAYLRDPDGNKICAIYRMA